MIRDAVTTDYSRLPRMVVVVGLVSLFDEIPSLIGAATERRAMHGFLHYWTAAAS